MPHIVAAIRKEVLTPAPHLSPKMGCPGTGGRGTKIHPGIIFCPKRMILEGVGHPIPQLGVCYAKQPKKKGGGYTMPAPASNLTTSLRGDFVFSQDGHFGLVGGDPGGGGLPPLLWCMAILRLPWRGLTYPYRRQPFYYIPGVTMRQAGHIKEDTFQTALVVVHKPTHALR